MSVANVEHTKLPWRVEHDTDLIWGACNKDDQTTYGMGYPIASGFTSFGSWTKGRPEFQEKEANAAFIVSACNSHYDLLEAVYETRKLVSEAASVGFNYTDGDWAERLYANQALLSAAIAKAEGRT